MLVVSLPLVVVLGFAGFTIKDRFDALGAEQQYGELIGPFEAVTRVARTIGDEGVASEWYLHAPEEARTRLEESVRDGRSHCCFRPSSTRCSRRAR